MNETALCHKRIFHATNSIAHLLRQLAGKVEELAKAEEDLTRSRSPEAPKFPTLVEMLHPAVEPPCKEPRAKIPPEIPGETLSEWCRRAIQLNPASTSSRIADMRPKSRRGSITGILSRGAKAGYWRRDVVSRRFYPK